MSRDTDPNPLPKEATVAATILSEDTFDRSEYAAELDAAPGNLDVGTRLWLRTTASGSGRCGCGQASAARSTPTPAATSGPWWTPGIGRQRTADGTMITRDYHVGDTNYSEHSPDEPVIHDLENVGESQIRFVTVELLD